MRILDRIEQTPTTIIFDLDGTLRESEPGGDRFMLEFVASLGIDCSPECVIATRQWAHQYWASSECLMLDEKTYGKGEDAFWENYARRTLQTLGAPAGQVEKLSPLLHAHMAENYRPKDIIPADVIPTLIKLREAGLTLGLLTNRSQPVDDYLASVGLAEHLDFYITAGEIGVWKPDPEIFFYSLGAARAHPRETIYIGDNYYADVVGARKVGITPILIDREHIFPHPDCPVIYQIADLLGLFELA